MQTNDLHFIGGEGGRKRGENQTKTKGEKPFPAKSAVFNSKSLRKLK